MGVPLAKLTVFDKNRNFVSSVKIKVSSPRMLHDFMITEHYTIIPDLPVTFDPKRAIKNNEFIYKFEPTHPCRYGFLKRGCTDPEQVKWFSLPSHYVFHYVNAWEETNEKGEETVVTYGPVWNDIDIDFNQEHPFMRTDKK
mmetsp:Transcript_12485/g.20991  ORF Transcript_12485/g.20991 Transcript_12485/m.20991 type:complete len:141 (+) Transcript_12485:889-1311(+)